MSPSLGDQMKLALVTALGMVWAGSSGCGDSGSTPSGGGGSEAGGAPAEGGNGGSAEPPVEPDCYDETAALVIPEQTFDGIVLAQSLCTDQQIADVFAACVGPTATMEACDAFKAADVANEPCLTCLLPGQSPPYPLSVILPSEGFQYLTLFGCQAQAMGLPECAVPIESLLFCGRTACETCAEDENNDCVNYAINPPGVCNELGLPAGCEAVFQATSLDPACIGDATDFASAFQVLAKLYCAD